MAIHIRTATPNDFPAFCQLYNEVNDLHHAAHPDIFRHNQEAPIDREFYQELTDNEISVIFVAEAEDSIIGFVHVMLVDAPNIPILVTRRYARIDSISVTLAWQHRGVGHLLMAQAETWARAKDAESIELSVYEFNQSARNFYSESGFQPLTRKLRKHL